MVDLSQIERARERLFRDPSITAKTHAEAKQAFGEARKTHPRGYAALDGDMRQAMVGITALAGAEQLLAVEALKARCENWLTEAKTESERVAHHHRAMADEARFAPMRERNRQDWAERTGSPMMLAATTFANHLDDARRRIMSRRDDEEMLAILDTLSEHAKTLTRTIAIEHRAAKERLSASHQPALAA